MNAKAEYRKVIVLELNVDEANWLKEYIQHQLVQNESEETNAMRSTIFHALADAHPDNSEIDNTRPSWRKNKESA